MPWVDELETQLIAEGVAASAIFIGSKVTVPVKVDGSATLHLLSTGGTSGDATQNQTASPAYVHPGCQLTARANGLVAASAMARAAWAALVKVRNQTISGTWHRSLMALQEPFDSGLDPTTGQVMVRFNVLGDKRPS